MDQFWGTFECSQRQNLVFESRRDERCSRHSYATAQNEGRRIAEQLGFCSHNSAWDEPSGGPTDERDSSRSSRLLHLLRGGAGTVLIVPEEIHRTSFESTKRASRSLQGHISGKNDTFSEFRGIITCAVRNSTPKLFFLDRGRRRRPTDAQSGKAGRAIPPERYWWLELETE